MAAEVYSFPAASYKYTLPVADSGSSMLMCVVAGFGHTFIAALSGVVVPTMNNTSVLAMAVQPWPSVIVTVYTPAGRSVRACVVAPVLHAYANGGVPPVAAAEAVPLGVCWLFVAVENARAPSSCGSERLKVKLAVQP